jgi:hypothetical protein
MHAFDPLKLPPSNTLNVLRTPCTAVAVAATSHSPSPPRCPLYLLSIVKKKKKKKEEEEEGGTTISLEQSQYNYDSNFFMNFF